MQKVYDTASTAARRLIAYWTAIGSRIQPGVAEQDLQAFEQHHHVCLPQDFREYLTLCNGLSPQDSGHFDHDWLGLITFWPLEEISAMHDEASGDYFGFADFLIHSHLYVIQLSADVRLSGPIGVGDEHGIDEQLADNFSDFVDAYLRDPNRVLLHT